MSDLAWTNDKIHFTNITTGARQDQECTLEELRDVIKAPPYGMQEVLAQATLSLTTLGATYLTTGIVIPAGSIVKYAAIKINTLVVAGGTTVKVALGLHGGDVDKYGITASLLAGVEVAAAFATLVATQETLDIDGVVTNGSGLGNSNISAGNVSVAVIYDKPILISNF